MSWPLSYVFRCIHFLRGRIPESIRILVPVKRIKQLSWCWAEGYIFIIKLIHGVHKEKKTTVTTVKKRRKVH